MKLGAHVSIGKGFPGAVNQAYSIGCDGFQIFAGNPRGWARKPLADSEVAQFRKEREKYALWPVMVHLSYLPNPATTDPELYEKSVLTMVEDFSRANALGADFFVFHPGKAKDRDIGLKKIIAAVNLVLEKVKGSTLLLFENQSGAGGEVAGSFQDLGLLIKEVNQGDRVGVCFDTCHAFAAGYDLSSDSGWQQTLDEFEKFVGLSNLKIFHLNDAVGTVGSHLDRHQHIGRGMIGLQGFSFLMNHPRLNQLPGILETPQEAPDDDLMNLKTLRQLVK